MMNLVIFTLCLCLAYCQDPQRTNIEGETDYNIGDLGDAEKRLDVPFYEHEPVDGLGELDNEVADPNSEPVDAPDWIGGDIPPGPDAQNEENDNDNDADFESDDDIYFQNDDGTDYDSVVWDDVQEGEEVPFLTDVEPETIFETETISEKQENGEPAEDSGAADFPVPVSPAPQTGDVENETVGDKVLVDVPIYDQEPVDSIGGDIPPRPDAQNEENGNDNDADFEYDDGTYLQTDDETNIDSVVDDIQEGEEVPVSVDVEAETISEDKVGGDDVDYKDHETDIENIDTDGTRLEGENHVSVEADNTIESQENIVDAHSSEDDEYIGKEDNEITDTDHNVPAHQFDYEQDKDSYKTGDDIELDGPSDYESDIADALASGSDDGGYGNDEDTNDYMQEESSVDIIEDEDKYKNNEQDSIHDIKYHGQDGELANMPDGDSEKGFSDYVNNDKHDDYDYETDVENIAMGGNSYYQTDDKTDIDSVVDDIQVGGDDVDYTDHEADLENIDTDETRLEDDNHNSGDEETLAVGGEGYDYVSAEADNAIVPIVDPVESQEDVVDAPSSDGQLYIAEDNVVTETDHDLPTRQFDYEKDKDSYQTGGDIELDEPSAYESDIADALAPASDDGGYGNDKNNNDYVQEESSVDITEDEDKYKNNEHESVHEIEYHGREGELANMAEGDAEVDYSDYYNNDKHDEDDDYTSISQLLPDNPVVMEGDNNVEEAFVDTPGKNIMGEFYEDDYNKILKENGPDNNSFSSYGAVTYFLLACLCASVMYVGYQYRYKLFNIVKHGQSSYKYRRLGHHFDGETA